MKLLNGEIISNERYSEYLYKMVIFSPYICREARPGQFVNIRCAPEGIYDPLLRRPFSIFDIEEKFNVFSILYSVKGRGTEFMSHLEKGDLIDFIGPLGNYIDLAGTKNNVLLIGGGIGIAPLYLLAKQAVVMKKNVFFAAGFKDKSYQKWEDDLIELKIDYTIYTEDGSIGSKGMICDYIRSNIKLFNGYDVYCCGPKEMLKTIQNIYTKSSNRVSVLLEEKMACGVGVCNGCVVKVKHVKGEFRYKRICKDGPTFDIREVIFD
ncbi:MAG: dihydroorotate dehydrogenase electron transfer subunit [Actinomycetota bacterium]|nr:dihydroorotate dehydrogenase electron transfer subunit [Actinomycetota bacterium]